MKARLIIVEKPTEAMLKAVEGMSTRRVRAAAATALTRTVVKAREVATRALARDIDRPTPYTMRQVKYIAASADRLVAAVGFNVVAVEDVFGRVLRYEDVGPDRTPAARYMRWAMRGGARSQKRFEKALEAVGVLPRGWRAVPGARAKMDAYGNQSVGELRQILSWFDAAEQVAGSRQNMYQPGREKRRKGTKKKAGFEYFVATVWAERSFVRANGKVGTHRMQPGIYRRTFFALGTRIEPVVIFVRATSYQRRYDFSGIVGRSINATLLPEFRRALADSAARRRK